MTPPADRPLSRERLRQAPAGAVVCDAEGHEYVKSAYKHVHGEYVRVEPGHPWSGWWVFPTGGLAPLSYVIAVSWPLYPGRTLPIAPPVAP